MEINNLNVYLLILGISIFTYIPRSFPIIYLSKRDLPTWLKEWMKFIPAAIFAALICPDIFTNNGRLDVSFNNIKLLSSIVVLIVALKKKSLGLSILVGGITITLLNLLIK